MPTALRVPHSAPAPAGLSQIAEEFRQLDLQRRRGGLSLGDAGRYHALFARLSDALASGERHRRADTRQFLRVSFPMELIVRRAEGPGRVACRDFGGGGCAITTHETLALEDDVWLDGAILEGAPHPLHGRAIVTWARLPQGDGAASYGLRFAIDHGSERDQIDRLFYRVLDRFLQR